MSEVEEIVSLSSVSVYQLAYQSSEHEFNLTGVVSDAVAKVFRESQPETSKKQFPELDRRIALLKCRDWYYPLEAGQTTVYRRVADNYKCFIFTDPNNCNNYSLLIIDSRVDAAKVLLFENVLLLYSNIRDAPEEWKNVIAQLGDFRWDQPVGQDIRIDGEDAAEAGRRQGTADVIASNIVSGAEFINSGIEKGTELVSGLVKRGAQHIKGQQCRCAAETTAADQPAVDPKVVSVLHGLRRASQTASAVTGACVSVVAKGTGQLGSMLAPHVRKHGTALISNVSGKDENSSGKVCDDILTVTSGGVQGFATLYNGITNNAISLAKTIADETSGVLGLRYGREAGQAAHEALYAAGNVALTVQNVNHLGPKAIVKKVAQDTGKSVLNADKKDDEESQRKA